MAKYFNGLETDLCCLYVAQLRHYLARFAGAIGIVHDCFGSYMDTPGLPSIHFMMSQQEKIAPVHPDFDAAFGVAVPDGIC